MKPADSGPRAASLASDGAGSPNAASQDRRVDGGRAAGTLVHLVSNDAKLRRFISVLLMNYCYLVTDADVAMAATEDLQGEHRDLIIVDSVDSDPETVRAVVDRLSGPRVRGVVLLTDEDEVSVAPRLLGNSVDVLLSRPFEARQLLACVRGLLRRRAGLPAESRVSAGWLALWPLRSTAAFGTREFDLASAEGRILNALIVRAGTPVSRLHLLQQIGDSAGDDRSLSRHIYRLREKIGTDAEGRSPIRTIRGVGYMLVANPEPAPAARG